MANTSLNNIHVDGLRPVGCELANGAVAREAYGSFGLPQFLSYQSWNDGRLSLGLIARGVQQPIMDEHDPRLLNRSFIPSWSTTPIPNLSLGAGALIALADLQTVAQRTVLTGGSSWLDVLVLAPGLHWQQAADGLGRHFQQDAQDVPEKATATCCTGKQDAYEISNAVVLDYLRKLCADAKNGPVTLDVDLDKASETLKSRLKELLSRRRRLKEVTKQTLHVDWLSHLLYLTTPLLTISAITFTVLLEDWWTLGTILALMLARIFNIYIIKQRSKPLTPLPLPQPPPQDQAPGTDDPVTEYTVDLGGGRRVLLRGRPTDLRAVTAQAWLRRKTHVEGFFEAGGKLLVYMVAACSGNLTQAGSIVLMALLLTSAGLLGLSNAHLKGFRMHGRVARLETRGGDGDSGTVELDPVA
ncbi:hypothetical protein HJFPF1_05568 [Paramyrothecium foliicola]|nr:hypothetical protein HJFPF1_05568 [Paramyrothecium foliicola]